MIQKNQKEVVELVYATAWTKDLNSMAKVVLCEKIIKMKHIVKNTSDYSEESVLYAKSFLATVKDCENNNA